VRRQLEERQKVWIWSWGIALELGHRIRGPRQEKHPWQECQQDAFALSLGAGKIFNTSTS